MAEPKTQQEWMDQEGILFAERDNCEFCLGFKGGVRGNENIIGDRTVCDYCHSLFVDITENLACSAAA